jgi:hypothetical protein
MSDLLTTTDAPTIAPDDEKFFVTVPLKNGAGEVRVDTRSFNDEVYKEVLLQGIKVIAERNMSKLTKEAYPVETERKAAILAKAQANVKAMADGTIKITGKTIKKVSGAIMTEAMRLGRNLVKDAMKANKIKISHVKASEITAAAKALLESDPSIVATAEANLKAREAKPMTIDIASLIHVDPTLVAKDEAKKAKERAEKPLSAKQAGKVAPRAKGAKPVAQANA